MKPKHHEDVQTVKALSQDDQELTLKNLMPNTKYDVEICAVNSKGTGSVLTFDFRTHVGKPPPLKTPEVLEGESTEQYIPISFHPASQRNGAIR